MVEPVDLVPACVAPSPARLAAALSPVNATSFVGGIVVLLLAGLLALFASDTALNVIVVGAA